MLCVLRRCFRPRVASFYYCCYYSALIFDFPPLIQAACFVFAFSQPDTIQKLLKRIEILETHQKGDIEAQIARLSTYGQRHLSDFDKYTALSMAESLASDAKQVNHSKASFLAVASQTLRSHLQKSSKVFQAYFLALFADKEYTQILDRISKVDKSFRSDPASRAYNTPQEPPGASSRGFMKSQRLICFYCDIAGHTANRCYRRIQPARSANRFTPYSTRGRGINK